MIKIKLGIILRFLSNYLLNFFKYTRGHMCHFFLSVRFKINLSEVGEINLFGKFKIKNNVTYFKSRQINLTNIMEIIFV